MKKSILWLISLTCLFTCHTAAQTMVEGGVVSGIWTKAGSPYIINGTVSVPAESVLSIEPGVEITFSGHFKFEIFGKLNARGLASDSIVFTASDKKIGWHGLRFMNTISSGQDTSKLTYCRIEYGRVMGDCPDNRGGGIYAELSNLIVSHCLIRRNQAVSGLSDWGGGAIYLEKSNAIIRDNLITQNYSGNDGGAIYCSFCRPIIQRNTISHNEALSRGGGIASFTFASPEILNNSISNNISHDRGGGICVSGGNPLIQHNKIENNEAGLGGGIDCYLSSALIINNLIATNTAGAGGAMFLRGSSPVITSNTICKNEASLYGGGIASSFEVVGNPVYSNPTLTANIIYSNVSDDGSQLWSANGCVPVLVHCDVQDMESGGITGEYNPVSGNISQPPVFTDVGLNEFELSNLSPCVDAGPVNLTGTSCANCDLNGCIRVWDGDGDQIAVIDMGAWEYGSQALGMEEAQPVKKTFFSCFVYPNPTKDNLIIKVKVPYPGKAEIRITQPDGQKIYQLPTYLSDDENDVTIDLSRLQAGVYIYEVYFMGYRNSGYIVHL